MPRFTLIAAAGVVVVANAIAVGLAAYNRSGPPVATAVLTERELALPPADPDNTGLWFEFRWQSPAAGLTDDAAGESASRNRAALEALGFDCSVPLDDPSARRHYRRLLARRGFVVLELGGHRWQAFADAVGRGAEDPPWTRRTGTEGSAPSADAAERWRRERLTGSRLIPVDAGPDAEILRRRYPDADRYLVVPAVVRLGLVEPTPSAPGRFALTVTQIWPAVIHVPRHHRAALDAVARTPRRDDDQWDASRLEPRYEVTVHYGRRGEPWIGGVRRLPAPAVSPETK